MWFFYHSHCVFQDEDSGRMIGHARERDGLYYLKAPSHTTRKMRNNDAFYASRNAKDDTSLKRPLRLCHYMC